MDNWDATFSEQWTCSDLVDCIISYAITKIVETITIDGVPRLDPLRACVLCMLAGRYLVLKQGTGGAHARYAARIPVVHFPVFPLGLLLSLLPFQL